MKNILFIAILLFLGNVGFTQNVIYGYPSDKESLKSGDVIILSGPPHRDGKYIQSEKLDEFIAYFSEGFNYNFRIEINIFYGGNDSSSAYSKRLCNMLQIIFEENDIQGFTIVSNGSGKPIYLNTDSEQYKQYNTRMEIHIE